MSSGESGTAQTGSPVNEAVIGVDDLERSLAFYRERVGLELVERRTLDGDAFARHWAVPAGTIAETAVLADRGHDVGRVTLIDFHMPGKVPIRARAGQRYYGYVNLNFYTPDIRAKMREFEAVGCRPWGPAVQHFMGPTVGAPTEGMLDGPDTVMFNLVELSELDPAKRVGHMRRYVADEFGYNRAGLTPVVTTAHNVRDMALATRFYREVLGMTVLIDELLNQPEQNRLLEFPEDGRTHCVFVVGNHLFGKIAMAQPLNYAFADLTPAAVPPNIGYIAQTFVVPELDRALAAAAGFDAPVYSPALELDLPGHGPCRAAIVRHPASHALVRLVQRQG